MDIAAIGSLLGGIGQAAGGVAGLFNNRGSTPDNSTFYQNWRNDDLANIEKNRQMQYEFAQNGIRWRVADARAAGIHPLAALGSPGASATPIAIGPGYNVDFGRSGGGSDIGSSLANMGQGVGRAVASTQTKVERQLTAFELMRQEQQIRAGDLDIAIKGAQLAKMTESQTGPGMPGSVDSGAHKIVPAEITAGQKGNSTTEAGPPAPGNRFVRLPGDHYIPMPAKDLNIDELSSPGGLSWSIINRLLPFFDRKVWEQSQPRLSDLPPGHHAWRYTPLGWMPVPSPKDFSHLPVRPQEWEQERFRRINADRYRR